MQNNKNQYSARLILADGTVFNGQSIGAAGQTVGEVVFNTAMTGYQEILTDPSYKKQIVTLTYPHIGNTGVNSEDAESDAVHAAGLVIRDLPLLQSNWRSEQNLSDYLKINNTVAIADIDTRKLTRILREKGAQNGVIIAGENINNNQIEQAKQALMNFSGLKGLDLAQVVSTEKTYEWRETVWDLGIGYKTIDKADLPFHVVAYDYGIKRNILRMLVARGCRVTVVPAKTPAEDILAYQPDGIFLSNGPGDPAPCDYAISAIQTLLESEIPIFGICLGHQLLGLAAGAQSIKMKFGHHGANHPVQDLASKVVMISSQNHGFALDKDTLPTHLKMTYQSLFDGSLQGIEHTTKPAFSFQGHPEASPGPHDVAPVFDRFIDLMNASK